MASARAAKKPKPADPIRHDDRAPGPAQAAQIALQVMKKLGCQTWKGVVELAGTTDVRTRVFLSPEQQSIIDEYANVLPYLSTSPLVTVVACPVCGRYGLQDKRSPGTKCIFTARCEGKPVKASSAPPRRAAAAPELTDPVEGPAGADPSPQDTPELPVVDSLFD